MDKTAIEEIFNRMRWFKDGDEVCVVLDDFVDLQESPAYFLNIKNILMGAECENCLDDPEVPICTTCGRKWNKQ